MEISDLELDISSLPKEKYFGNDFLCQVDGFWCLPKFIKPVYRVINNFKPLPTDIILVSFPKTGTTWLKSLLYAIINRSSKHHLATKHPHDLVPFLELQLYAKSDNPHQIMTDINVSETKLPRVFGTHIPYKLLAKPLDSSECRVVYLTRNPKDTLISAWKFGNKWKKNEDEYWPLEVATDKFCNGITPYGPYHEHVMGYKKASLENPKKLFFITYEELKNEPITHVKKLAEFLGYPFEGNDDDEVQEIVKNCSIEVLSNHEVNKSNELTNWFPFPYNSFFRKGEIGDYKNYLNNESIERIDGLTKEKFHSMGFDYGI